MSAPKRILVLGGTGEARVLAARLQAQGFAITLSLAGRTRAPADQGVPVRVGGFGGVDGLADFLREQKIDLLVDATHPYAAQISANAASAANRTGTPIIALRRPAWQQIDGDRWISVADAGEAVLKVGTEKRNVFLALGRQEIAPFEAAPQHSYLIRSVDPVDPPLAVPDATYLLARGPFDADGEHAMLAANGIEAIVAKNSGGAATYAKIEAARTLGIAVYLIARPVLPDVPAAETVEEAVAMAHQALTLPKERGV